MRKSWLCVAIGVLALTQALGSTDRAADHRDGPGVADSTTDITDLYTWMAPAGDKLYLVLDVQGANTGATATTRFSDAALYTFHLNQASKFGAAPSAQATIICKFDAAATQGFQCWGPSGEYVSGATNVAAGVKSSTAKLKVFAGVRDDPFWFNIRGFLGLAGFVKSAAGALTFDAAGCPMIPPATAGIAVAMLKSDGGGMAGTGKDDFGKSGLAPGAVASPASAVTTNGNILSIVVAIDKNLVSTDTLPVVGVWASTNVAGAAK